MYIGFSTTGSVVSGIIRWLTRSKASHSFIRFQVAGEDVVLHSTSHGVNLDYYPKFAKKNKIICEHKITMTKANENKAIGYALKQLDRPYDYLAIAGFLWVLIAKSFGKKVKNPFPNRSAYFCSELTVNALKEAGFKSADKLDPELTSPEDLMEFIDNHAKSEAIS